MHSDSLAFETLYKTYYTSLCSTAHYLVSNEDDAHDIVQDVFLKLWHRPKHLDEILHHKSYLVRSVINASLRFIENRKPLLSLVHKDTENIPNTDPNVQQAELISSIQKALNNLPPRCRAIFILSRVEQMKYKEIAEHLGVSVKTVENQMGIAFKKLRADLGPYLTREFLALAAGTGLLVLWRSVFSN